MRKITGQSAMTPTAELDKAAETLARFAIQNDLKPGKGIGFFIPSVEIDGEMIGPWEIEITRTEGHNSEEATAAICLRTTPTFPAPEDAIKGFCSLCGHDIAHEKQTPNVPKVCLECFIEVGEGNIGAALERSAN